MPRSRTFLLPLALAAFGLTATASAQVVHNEVEPNSVRLEATFVTGLAPGDSIVGLSTGAGTTAGSTDANTVDMYRVSTAPLPLGIYKHQLVLTTTTTTGHTGTIRGLQVQNGVVTTTDATQQTTTAASAPPRAVQWFGFGRQEELYYRVAGAAATTANYTATFGTVVVTPTAVPTPFQAGLITLTSAGRSPTDTEIFVYDSTLHPIPGFHNDNHASSGNSATLSRVFAPGTYYVAVSDPNTANNLPESNPDEQTPNQSVVDFPDVLVSGDREATFVNYGISISDGFSTVPVALVGDGEFDVSWARFDVVAGGPPANDDCAAPTVVTLSIQGQAMLYGNTGTASNDGTASCDLGGAASRDVWYSVTTDVNGTLTVDTCGFATETVLSAHTACGGTEIACNDDCASGSCSAPASCLQVPVIGGQATLLRVSDNGTGGGLFRMNLGFVGTPPSNDDCSTPIVLPGPGTYPFDITWATTSPAIPPLTPPCTTNPRKDVWYVYTATGNGVLRVSLCGGVTSNDTDTLVAVYAGSSCPTSAGIACNDDADIACPGGPNGVSVVSLIVACGDVVLIQLGSAVNGRNIAGTFDVLEIGNDCSTPLGPIKRVPSQFPRIQDAIDACINGDTVLVAPGTYMENITFGGRNITVKSEDGPTVTTIDANQSGCGVLFRNQETRAAVLEGFTITNGSGILLSPFYYGAGITCMSNSSPTIRGNIITGNGPVQHGGGMMSYLNANPLIIGNVISDNACAASGGGIYFSTGNGEVRNNVIRGNVAGSGGGINMSFNGAQTISNNLIVGNLATNGGGVAGGFNANSQFTNNTIVGNTATSTGGGLRFTSSPVVRSCIVWGNTAPTAPSVNPATLNIEYSIVEGGYAGQGNLSSDPLFVSGPNGSYYLSDVSSGQAATSPGVDAGDPAGLLVPGTTRTDGAPDLGVVDVGYHAPEHSQLDLYCFGDGSGAACPCGNESPAGADGGCLSSLGAAGLLRGSGSTQLVSDTLVLAGAQMPNTSVLYFQGTSPVLGGAGIGFGDGLRCVGGSIVRLGTKANLGGASQYPDVGDPSVSVRGLVPATGGLRYYQAWYRNAASFCTTATFNLTNAIVVNWTL